MVRYNSYEVSALTVVYIDRVFALNAMIDYLLLLTTAQLMGAPLRRWQIAIAAGIGGIYAAAVYAVSWLEMPPIRIMVGILLPLIGFYQQRHIWRHTALFLLLSGSLAGLLLAIGFISGRPTMLLRHISRGEINFFALIAAALIFYCLLHLLFRQEARFEKGELMDITISINGKLCRIRALYDTGNTLRNPIDGTSVLVAEAEALSALWTEETSEILHENFSPEEKLTRLYQNGNTRFSLLPFCGIGKEHGLLLAARSDYIQIGRRIRPKILIALYPTPIGGAAYHALWGGRENDDASVACDMELDQPKQVG